MKSFVTVIFCLTISLSMFSQKTYNLLSPDEKINVKVEVTDGQVYYSVRHENDNVIIPSPISMTLTNGTTLGKNAYVRKNSQHSVNQLINAPIYKRKVITDNYNELVLSFKGDYNIIFRAYNEGVAYRFVSQTKEAFKVAGEKAVFRFDKSYNTFIPYVRGAVSKDLNSYFFNSFENTYEEMPLKTVDCDRLMFLPLLVKLENGKKVVITEADLEDYPGMYLQHVTDGNSLKGVFAGYPKKEEQGGVSNIQLLVSAREDYIAEISGSRSFPWRILIISDNDRELADNDMVYKLASPSRVSDVSWIKPGKATWEWWNSCNLTGVGFRAGVNNDTYKYYIDFAQKNGIEYILIDAGWSVKGKADLFEIVPEVDLEELIAYGKERNVGIVLWAGYYAMDRDMEKVCKHYSEMGIKGFKVDFMNRDDQKMVRFFYRLAETAARYKLLVEYHGAYKPTGLQRTYPNAINYEGVYGLEMMKFNDKVDQVTYDVTIPFIRMIAGPFDYTQGAMKNAVKTNFRAVYSEPMSQGTRCHQIAEYIIFESPFSMLCDSPVSYERESECTEFISPIPTVWDNTIAIDGKVGEYVIIARNKVNYWYVGALTNWDSRSVEIDLSFLGNGDFNAEVFKDGINSDRNATDYVHEIINVPQSKKITIKMAPGGGMAMRIIRKN